MTIPLPSTETIAEYFSKNVNWDFFYSSLDTLGKSLNSPKNRFDKSDILELAIEVFSDEKIKHFNQTGRDFFIPELNCHCEMKFSENESHLLDNSSQIKTEGYEENLKFYKAEGRMWMRKKYGFNSHWSMQQYVKGFYDKFFEFHPEYSRFRVLAPIVLAER